MKADPLRELKEKIVKFVTQCIDESISKMNIVIDYEGCQFETECFIKHEPNKTPKKKYAHGTYKLVEEKKNEEPTVDKVDEGGNDQDVQGDVPGNDGEGDRGKAE